ncbi:hypothetical protein AX17_002900 [Amanita inopinata Kibby_2008]|nr:hypothetical protein AX17_002900 [Amanita inopinata Kibby_2008]
MSADDSGSDLGGFAPTTPLPHPKRKRANAKPNSRTAEPGPSSKPSKPVARKRATNKRFSPPDNDSEVQEIVPSPKKQFFPDVVDEDDDGIQLVEPSEGRKRQGGFTPQATVTNGKSAAKGKARVRGVASKVAKKDSPPQAEAIDVDAVDEDENMDVDVNETSRETIRPVHTAQEGRTTDRATREESRIAEKLRRAEEQVRLLAEKLEETQRIRETEAEKLMKAKDEQFHAQLRAQGTLIESLTSQLAQKETLASTGRGSILHMITREAADEEKRNLEKEMIRLKEALHKKEEELKEKDRRITELNAIEKELRFELRAEIERAKNLTDKSLRTPQAAPKSRVGGATPFEDPKNAQVIRFYEDVTNLLVVNMKHQPGQRLGSDEWILTCFYTYSEDDMSPSVQQKSIAFTLHTSRGSPTDGPESDSNEESIHYIPQNLDKEPQDFVDKLGFLNQPFKFSRRQLSLFLRTMYDNLKDALSGDGDSDQGDEVEVLEK